jgi:tRNA-2-methylthio-N6-dimethylallyladenosine synthase
MPQYYIWTTGCQMNKAESARLAADLETRNYTPISSPDGADLIILNSCVVRQSAEDKVRNKLASLQAAKRVNPGLKLALTGCLVDSNNDMLRHDFPQVDYFFQAGALPPWANDNNWSPEIITPEAFAYVSIMQGCNNFCAYCIVPYRRGRERSRQPDEIAAEVGGLAEKGVREITLLGQNVDSYGHDLPDKPDLASLLHRLNAIPKLKRLRFLTNHPKDMSDELIAAVARLERVCELICLPMQAGSDSILAAMRRGYTVEHFRGLVRRVRAAVPGVALSTDVIVGFPGETEAQYNETRQLLEDLRFDVVHLAAYSPRPGTYASRHLADDVPAGVKKARFAELEAMQGKIALEINEKLLGGETEILVEGRKKGKWYGRTRTDKLVFCSGDLRPGQAVTVEITDVSPWSLQGKLKSIAND